MIFHLKRDVIEDSTLVRYCTALKHFSNFLEKENVNLEQFSNLTPLLVDKYIFYLKSNLKSASTMLVAYSAIKSIVRRGQFLQDSKFPIAEVFPTNTVRLFGLEDMFTTKSISDFILFQVDTAVNKEPLNTNCFKTLLSIARETGLRISEILLLEENCVQEDFVGNPLLFTISPKIDEERAVPITLELASLIQETIEFSLKYRISNKTIRIFKMNQSRARELLKSFIKRHKIVDETGKLAEFTFHSFRHTLGCEMINNGMDTIDIKNQLGHKSNHSTSIYAKISDKTLQKEYESIGFIGISEKQLLDNLNDTDKIVAEQKLIQGALPDGTCLKPFEGETICKKFNMCLFCSKYRTFIKDLPTHKAHLERIREDRYLYMSDMSIGNLTHLQKIEEILVKIIHELEALI